MRRRLLAESISASVLSLFLLTAANAQSGPDLGLPLPEMPPLRILPAEAEAKPDVASTPSVIVRVEPETETDRTVETTGSVVPHALRGSAAPTEALVASPPEPETGEPAVLDIPPTEMPPVDPALRAQEPAASPPPAAAAALDLPPPEMPPADPALAAPLPAEAPAVAPAAAPAPVPPPDRPVNAEAPQTEPTLSAEMAARAEAALAVPRLAAREREEIVAAYVANGSRPFWADGKGWTAAGRRLSAQLGRAAEDGLRRADYALPAFEASDAGAVAEADMRLSALAVLYARDARGGRIDPRRLSKLITPKLDLPSATEVLSELAAADDPGALLAGFNPPHEEYRRLKAKLAELRIDRPEDVPSVRIPPGPPLRLGMRDQRVPLVRARLGLDPIAEPVYDRSMATALAEFQEKAGLPADGVLGAATLAALGAPAHTSRLEADVIAQMERWRWLPSDLGSRHIIVNLPEFLVRVVKDGTVIHQVRAIVGKPESATPIFSHVMDHVVVNPSWFVPPSILKKEFLPGLAADPNYAAKRGYVVTRRGNAISVRQPPGERNALGNIKFMFPNDHAVYLHDTPNRSLFGTGRRAYSHGCVRVDNPFALADIVLGDAWSHGRLRQLIGKGERTIKLPEPLPIHLVYNTLTVDEAGRITNFDDLYGFHRLVRNALEPFS